MGECSCPKRLGVKLGPPCHPHSVVRHTGWYMVPTWPFSGQGRHPHLTVKRTSNPDHETAQKRACGGQDQFTSVAFPLQSALVKTVLIEKI
jgi:hypothetical protein